MRPADESTTDSRRPTVLATLTDAGSGIDPNGILLKIDGRTQGVSSFAYDGLTSEFTHTSDREFQHESNHLVWMQARDYAGNISDPVMSRFTVKTKKKTSWWRRLLWELLKWPKRYFNCRKPALSVMLAPPDDVYVQVATIHTFIDQHGVSFSYNPNTSEFIFHSPELEDGEHTMSFAGLDTDYELLQFIYSFVIDTIPPKLTACLEPTTNTPLRSGDYIDPHTGIAFEVEDNGSGIKEETIRINPSAGTDGNTVRKANRAFSFAEDQRQSGEQVFDLQGAGAGRWRVLWKPGDILPDGRYTIAFYAEDMAGNAVDPDPMILVVAGDLRLDDLAVYPNPARTEARFAFQISKEADITIEIYTLTGELCRALNARSAAGYSEILWNLENDYSNKVASGLYHYRITADDGQNRVREIKSMAIKR